MSRNVKKILGTVTVIILGIIYLAIAIIFSELFLDKLSGPYRILFYIVIGLFWIIPLIPIIKWMDKNENYEKTEETNKRETI